jgi:predicted secreted hydrolase
MSRRARWLGAASALLALGLLGWWLGPRPGGPLTATLSVSDALSQGAGGFERALVPRPFRFPEDHGPHPTFRTEWWYFTGHLEGEGRRFGFQLTFFRSGLAPGQPERASAWAANELYLAHFALSDVDGGRFASFDRWQRPVLGLAGAQADPFRVWVLDWEARGAKAVGAGIPPLTLAAAEDDVALTLELAAGKPVVLHGEQGLSRKAAEPGNASYYYSFPRLPARGQVRLGGQTFAVTGNAWMDREWSTSVLSREQVGWDWFSLQLGDGSELMWFELRDAAGRVTASSGTRVAADGSARALPADALTVEVQGTWQSPRSLARYPARWRLRSAGEALDLELVPLLADQELDVAFRYWEGAVAVRGTSAGAPITGEGYVEMTGYEPRPASPAAPGNPR